jgi:hypothetical protein
MYVCGISQVITALSAPGACILLQCADNTVPLLSCMCANLNCNFEQTFVHLPSVLAAETLLQSLLGGLCIQAEFQVRFQPHQLDHSLVRRIFVRKRYEVMGGWRKLLKEQLCNLYSLPNKIRMIKSRKMSWVGHTACMEAEKYVQHFG